MTIKKNLIVILLLLGNIIDTKAQVKQIPFDFNGHHIYIKVNTKNGDSLQFIFDTGATNATIDSASAEKAGVDKADRKIISVGGAGGNQSYTMVFHQNLLVNDLELKNLNLIMVNFSKLSAEVKSRIDGIIGYEVLSRYVTKLDFDHRNILLYNDISSTDTTGYTGIPFEFSKGIVIPRFQVSITLSNGETFTGKAMFDTGNAATLLVSAPFSKFHSFEAKLGQTRITQGRGLNAVTRDEKANIRALSFSGFKFGKMGIGLTVDEKAEAKDGYLGILGIDVIKRFNVVLDYEHRKIYLKPNRGYKAKFTLEEFRKQS